MEREEVGERGCLTARGRCGLSSVLTMLLQDRPVAVEWQVPSTRNPAKAQRIETEAARGVGQAVREWETGNKLWKMRDRLWAS